MSKISQRLRVRVVGANPEGGGVLTYVQNLQSNDLETVIYGRNDLFKFCKDLKTGDTVFFNVIKPSLPFLFACLLLLKYRFRLVYCGHGLNYQNNKGLRRQLVYFFEWLMSVLSDGVVVLNECDMEKFQVWNNNSQLLPTALKPRHNSFEPNLFNTESISWLAVGKVEDRKDPLNFIKVAKEVLAINPRDQFTWIGDGPEFSRMQAITKAIDGIDFIGPLDNVNVRERMFSSDVFICSSTYEVLPISILEAAEGGCVLVVRNYHYSSDISIRFKSSLVYSKIDDIVELRGNDQVLTGLREEALNQQSSLQSQYDLYITKMSEILCY